MNIADIGRNHLRNALTGHMSSCDVEEWLDEEGKPVKIYWRPLTGIQQQQIEKAGTEVERVCMALKVRALDKDGNLIFKDTALAGLVNDYDYTVIRAIVFLMMTEMGQNKSEEIEKE